MYPAPDRISHSSFFSFFFFFALILIISSFRLLTIILHRVFDLVSNNPTYHRSSYIYIYIHFWREIIMCVEREIRFPYNHVYFNKVCVRQITRSKKIQRRKYLIKGQLIIAKSKRNESPRIENKFKGSV